MGKLRRGHLSPHRLLNRFNIAIDCLACKDAAQKSLFVIPKSGIKRGNAGGRSPSVHKRRYSFPYVVEVFCFAVANKQFSESTFASR